VRTLAHSSAKNANEWGTRLEGLGSDWRSGSPLHCIPQAGFKAAAMSTLKPISQKWASRPAFATFPNVGTVDHRVNPPPLGRPIGIMDLRGVETPNLWTEGSCT
jgi:hypothetical protein